MNEIQLNHNAFLIIPAYVADNPNIDDSEAMLFGRLNALSNQKGYCYASNLYLAKVTKVSESEIKKRLSTLEKEGVIKRFAIKVGMEWERKIYTCNNFSQIISTKDSNGSFERIQTDPSKGFKRSPYINKSINNISINKETLPKGRVKKDADALSILPKKEKLLFTKYLEKFKEEVQEAHKLLGLEEPNIQFSASNFDYCDKILDKYGEEEAINVLKFAIRDDFWMQVIKKPYNLFRNFDKIKLNMIKSNDKYAGKSKNLKNSSKQYSTDALIRRSNGITVIPPKGKIKDKGEKNAITI